MKILVRLRNLSRNEHGAGLIETALVLPILFLLVLGALDFGRAYYVYLEVVNAAHAGAEYGSLNPADTQGITDAAQQAAHDVTNLTVPTAVYGCECGSVGASTYSASCTAVPACADRVYRVQVTAQSIYTPLVPWKGFASSITLKSTATMRGNY